MDIESCSSFEGCSAPLCPLYEHNKESVWYPDEDICVSRIYKPGWVKKQRKIKKKTRDKETYYTIEMLNSAKNISAGIRGLDADGRRLEESFIKSRARPTPTTTPIVFAQKPSALRVDKRITPQDMPKSPYQPKLINN